jgi:glycosyltransferase involved in cell wall biosynthesis
LAVDRGEYLQAIMKILYVSTLGGGVDSSLKVLAQGLIKKGHKVSFLYITSSEVPENKTIKIYQTPAGNIHYYLSKFLPLGSLSRTLRSLEVSAAFCKKLLQIISTEKPDIVEVPEMFIPRFLLKKIPVIIRLHSADWTWREFLGERQRLSEKIDICLESKTLKKAAGISSPDIFLKEYVSRKCKVEKEIVVIPYAIDIEKFKPGLKDPRPTILFVGRIERRKGAHLLLRAIPEILIRFPNARFIFAGQLCDDVKSEVEKVKNKIELLGVISHDSLVQWYQQAWILVAMSLWDNSPNTIYEAMACETPVVANPVGGIPELVDSERTGFLVNSQLEMTGAILRLLENSDLRTSMGRESRKKVLSHYSLDFISHQTLDYYQSCISHS